MRENHLLHITYHQSAQESCTGPKYSDFITGDFRFYIQIAGFQHGYFAEHSHEFGVFIDPGKKPTLRQR
jgi:hypothetical protein